MTLEETLIRTFDEGYTKGEKSGTAAERKRILFIIESRKGTFTGIRTYESLVRAIEVEHPEPDAGETKS